MERQESGLQIIRREEPGATRLLRLLEGLESRRDAETILLRPGDAALDVLRPDDDPALTATLACLLDRHGRSEAGLVLYWSSTRAFAVRPPLALPGSARYPGWEAEPLLEMLGQPHLLAIFLLRRGGYATGVFRGDILIAAKNGQRFVKNRHRKGGQSQRRFDRIREKQVDELFEKACDVARERFEPYRGVLDALFLGGDRRTVQAFMAQCRYLREFGPQLQPRFLTTPEPRHDTLAFAYDRIWRSEWLELGAGQ